MELEQKKQIIDFVWQKNRQARYQIEIENITTNLKISNSNKP